jgi:hypothetical protein
MQILLQLLEYSKKHSQAIIVVLLGVISAGSIAGGIHVRDLSVIIAEKNHLLEQKEKIEQQRNALEGQRLLAVEATWRARLVQASLDVGRAKSDVEQIQTESKQLRTDVETFEGYFDRHLALDDDIARTLTQLADNNIKATMPREVRAAAMELTNNSISSRADKARTKQWIDQTTTRIDALHSVVTGYTTALQTTTSGEVAYAAPSNYTFLIVTLMLFVTVVVGTLLTIRRFRHLKRIAGPTKSRRSP